MIPWKSPRRIALELPAIAPLLPADAAACAGPFVQGDGALCADGPRDASPQRAGEQPVGEGLLQRLREAGL